MLNNSCASMSFDKRWATWLGSSSGPGWWSLHFHTHFLNYPNLDRGMMWLALCFKDFTWEWKVSLLHTFVRMKQATLVLLASKGTGELNLTMWSERDIWWTTLIISETGEIIDAFLNIYNSKICFVLSLPWIPLVRQKVGVDITILKFQRKAFNWKFFKMYILWFRHFKWIRMINTFMLGNTVWFKNISGFTSL